MTRTFTATVVAALIAAPAAFAGATFSESLHHMVMDNKIVSVEVELLELDMARADTDHTVNQELRSVYAQFQTTDPAYVDFIHAWNQAYPNSLYAKVAKASYLEHVSRVAKQDHYTDMTFVADFSAIDGRGPSNIVSQAYAERPDFAPVSDLALSLQLASTAD
ncbi:MAG: hypothetical protein GY947_12650 [Rhodobacteraceae bacterium]|nr:hypothetical protein [Paracoccaceae bacterium]